MNLKDWINNGHFALNLKEKVSGLDTALKIHDEELKFMRQENAMLLGAVKSLTERNNLQDVRINDLKDEISNLKGDYRDMKADFRAAMGNPVIIEQSPKSSQPRIGGDGQDRLG